MASVKGKDPRKLHERQLETWIGEWMTDVNVDELGSSGIGCKSINGSG